MTKARGNIYRRLGGAFAIALLASVCGWFLLSALAARAYEDHAKGLESFEDPVAVEQTLQIGDQIVEALERYYSKHGAYPALLSDLVPVFSIDIPKPTAGYGEWRYFGSGDRYSLSFGVGRHTYPCYYRENGYEEWRVDT